MGYHFFSGFCLGLVSGLMVILCLLATTSHAQTAEWVPGPDDGKGKRLVINQVKLVGNKRTKDRIILRELQLEPGTNVKLADTAKFFRYECNKVFNTKLFNFVSIQVKHYRANPDTSIADTTDLVLNMSERWYFFPAPVFELADRSFNEWVYNRGASLSRVNYGIRVNQYNTFGYNDPASFTFQTGFARSYELAYSFPILDKKLNTSVTARVSYTTNKYIALETVNNKQKFDTASGPLGRTRFNASTSVSRRVGFFQTHVLTVNYDQNTIPEDFAAKNPDYFLDGRTYQQYLTLSYLFVYDYRNIRYYPTKGWYLVSALDVLGVLPGDNNRMLNLDVAFSKFFDLGDKWYSAHRLEVILSSPNQQSYLTSQGMRYGRYGIRGYELYLVEGPQLFINRNSLRRKLLTKVFNLDSFFGWKQFNKVPIEIYAKTYADCGFVNAPFATPTNGRLSNRFLMGGGFGLDIATFYDLIFKMEYSWNQLGDKPGFFVGMSYDI
jgi:outer membrane protein assembly factor BamA